MKDPLIHHALVLNFHQPPGNLDHLWDHQQWEAAQILYALDRVPRSLWGYEDVGRVHLALSGSLLETLCHPGFQEKVYGTVDCGKLLWHLQNEKIISLAGTGYYHPVFPLIPDRDWDEQMERWLKIARHLFWREKFSVFWPPEMGFDMRMIPTLVRQGYQVVMVDSRHVEALTPMSWHEIRFQPHRISYGGHSMIAVVRDREFSDAQESGMDLDWFKREIHARTRECRFPPLVLTATDGDNGGWFRNVTPGSNFWEAFYHPMLREIQAGQSQIKPTFIEDYVAQYGVHGEVRVHTGAWNTGWHHGTGFIQWTGTSSQREGLARIAAFSEELHRLEGLMDGGKMDETRAALVEEIRWRILRAETSCHFFWGDAWVYRAHRDLDDALEPLGKLQGALGEKVREPVEVLDKDDASLPCGLQEA